MRPIFTNCNLIPNELNSPISVVLSAADIPIDICERAFCIESIETVQLRSLEEFDVVEILWEKGDLFQE